jgi:RimJ/RimL family protein N-acetyltransferase
MGSETKAIAFRPLAQADLPLLHEWLNREHVRRWWRGPRTFEDVEAQYRPAIAREEPTRLFAIVLEARPAGMVQTYLCTDYPDWIGDEPGVIGVDLFIADEQLTGRGLGPRILVEFMRTIVFADPGVTACAASPETINAVSIRAFGKAGFRPVREIAGEWGPELLMRVEREDVLIGRATGPSRRTA